MPAPTNPEKRGRAYLIVLLLLVVAFAAAVLWVINMRLSKGDTYPTYSSFRADPVGARAFYEAIGRLDGVSSERHTRRIKYLVADDKTALLFIGISPDDFAPDSGGEEEEIIDNWLDQGGRIIVALQATSENRSFKDESKDGSPRPEKTEDEKGEVAEAAIIEGEGFVLPGLYGLTLKRVGRQKSGNEQSARGAFEGVPLPLWHGSHALEIHPQSDWTELAVANGETSIAILNRSNGEIIVLSDSYPLSNEAQMLDRHTPFLLTLVGMRSRVVFDESHHGVLQEPGLMNLVRRYHLHGVVVGGIVLFVVLLWQGSGSLIPVDDNKDLGFDSQGAVAGRDSTGGLVSLLESGLNPRQLLNECIDRYLAVQGKRKPDAEAVTQARAIADATKIGRLEKDFDQISNMFSKKPISKPNP